jgi:hypothetical protein
LFVEAVKLVKSIENVEGLEEKAVVLEEVLGKLNEIIDDYPSSDLAVKLISGQNIGAISLERVGEEIKKIRKRAERAAEWPYPTRVFVHSSPGCLDTSGDFGPTRAS